MLPITLTAGTTPAQAAAVTHAARLAADDVHYNAAGIRLLGAAVYAAIA